MNCLQSCMSSLSTPFMTRARAWSCSIRTFCRSEFSFALRYAESADTLAGISFVLFGGDIAKRQQEGVEPPVAAVDLLEVVTARVCRID